MCDHTKKVDLVGCDHLDHLVLYYFQLHPSYRKHPASHYQVRYFEPIGYLSPKHGHVAEDNQPSQFKTVFSLSMESGQADAGRDS